jgi:hypothetical protein
MDIPRKEEEQGIEIEKEHKPTITNIYQETEEREPSEEELLEAYQGIVEDHEKETIDLTSKPVYYEKYLIPMEDKMKEEGKDTTIKINSNIINVTKESSVYKELEEIITKIASENKIDNVEVIEIVLSPSKGMIGFKIAADALIDPMVTSAQQGVDTAQQKVNQSTTELQQAQSAKTQAESQAAATAEQAQKELNVGDYA